MSGARVSLVNDAYNSVCKPIFSFIKKLHSLVVRRRLGSGQFTFLLRKPYQNPYLLKLSELAEAGGAPIFLQNILTLPQKIGSSLAFHEAVFHCEPFKTHQFPFAYRHVLVSHAFDGGRFDQDGSWGFGRGRVLYGDKRLYDYILVTTPWSVELAEQEIPEYNGRVLMVGDFRADKILRLASEQPKKIESRRVIGIASSHSVLSMMGRHRGEVIPLLRALDTKVNVNLFIHPFERKYCGPIFDEIQGSSTIKLVGLEEFEEKLVQCDMLFSDYGGTGLYYSLLRRPLIQTDFDESIMLSNFPTMKLRKELHTISNLAIIDDYVDRFLHGETLLTPTSEFVEKLYPSGTTFKKYAPLAMQKLLASQSL